VWFHINVDNLSKNTRKHNKTQENTIKENKRQQNFGFVLKKKSF
jgi:hypothetical protein